MTMFNFINRIPHELWHHICPFYHKLVGPQWSTFKAMTHTTNVFNRVQIGVGDFQRLLQKLA